MNANFFTQLLAHLRAFGKWLAAHPESAQDSRCIQLLRLILMIIVCCSLVALTSSLLTSCSSRHYFSINAEEITNPSILYSDSTGLTNPF